MKVRGSTRERKYTPEFRVKVVKTALEKQLSVEGIQEVFNVGQSTYYPWKKIYVEQGKKHSSSTAPDRGAQGLGTAIELPPSCPYNIQRQMIA